MTHIRHSIRVAPLACAVAALMLAACSSGGSGSGSSPNPSPNDTTGVTPIGKVANGGGNTVVATGQAVSSLGSTLQNANIPGLSDQAKAGLGGTVGNAGKAVSDLGLGVQTGLGKMGQNPNPIGTTVASTGNVVTDLGQATVSAGSLVQGLGQGSGAPLAPITQPVGGGVQQVGQALIGGGTPLGIP